MSRQIFISQLFTLKLHTVLQTIALYQQQERMQAALLRSLHSLQDRLPRWSVHVGV